MRFVTGADRIVLWVTLAYAREYVIQHYAYAPVTKRIARELSRYVSKHPLRKINSYSPSRFVLLFQKAENVTIQCVMATQSVICQQFRIFRQPKK